MGIKQTVCDKRKKNLDTQAFLMVNMNNRLNKNACQNIPILDQEGKNSRCVHDQ